MKILSATRQHLTQEMKNIIKEHFKEEYQVWKEEGQKNLTGEYYLTVCEDVEISKDDEDYISVAISKDGNDGGYLHVYGMREK